MLPHYILFAVPVISLIGSSRYIYQVMKGKARPNRMSFALWALAPIIAFAAQIQQGVGLEAILTFMVGFGPLLIVVASFINPKLVWKLTRFDIVCGILSLTGLALWAITREGNVAIFFAIAADLLAGIPVLVKSWKAPETESYLVFLLGAVNAILTLLVVRVWSFETTAFPIYIFAICAVLVVFIRFQPGKRAQRLLDRELL